MDLAGLISQSLNLQRKSENLNEVLRFFILTRHPLQCIVYIHDKGGALWNIIALVFVIALICGEPGIRLLQCITKK